MAEPGRTVRVSGLPTDIEDDKLEDKLFIHFLRDRNGGGEIDSVIIVKATPASALITFEDSRVAQRVIHHGRHTLDIDGKKYQLAVTEHHEKPDPDQVILKLSATVRYHQLPGGLLSLTNVCKNHRDVELNYIATEKCCVISGAYSKVQAILAQLLGHPEGSQSSADHKISGEAALGGSAQQRTVPQEPGHQRTKPNKQRERNRLDKPPAEQSSRSDRDLTPGGYDWEDTGQTESPAKPPPSTALEDFSLIVDADMFQYLQKYRRDEYQNILGRYDVKVVDVTNQGVTTLFLQLAAEGSMRDVIIEQEHLMMAKNALSMFYQQNEMKIRRAQVPKVILPSRAELKGVIEALCTSHPKVLLNEDEENLYLIGSSSDVSDAKQFLLLDGSKARDKRSDGAADLKFSSYASGLSTHAEEKRFPLTPSSSGGFSDEKTDHFLKTLEDESRAEGAGRHKIAARFRDLGAAALGSRTTDFTSRAKSSTSRQSRSGPMLGHDVLSDTSKISGEAVSRAAAQSTGGDILFTGGSALPSFASVSNKASLRPEALDVRPKTSPVSASQTGLTGSTAVPPAGSGAALKRASSFSGTSQKQPQLMDQRSEENPSKPKARSRGRSSSFSSQGTPRERQEVHTAELTVPAVNWLHIREAYQVRLDDLTSDVQMTERQSDSRRDVVLVIRGASSSRVESCQTALQKLFDSVSSNFTVRELTLSELGVSDEADETLQACCSEVRSRFKKVTIQIVNGKMYFLGPEQLCSQVCASLREVFSGGLKKKPAEQHSPGLFTSQLNSVPPLQMNEDHSVSPHFKPQVGPESKAAKANGADRNKGWQTTYRNDFCEKEPMNGFTSPSSIRNDPVIKEKVKTTDPALKEGQKTNLLENDSGTGRFNGVTPTTVWSETQGDVRSSPVDGGGQEQANSESITEEPRSNQEDPAAFLCSVCETNGKSVTTKCGLAMCSKCQKSTHNNCTVCHEAEQKASGIQGRMSRKKLSISLPGYPKFSSVMITYSIPDGIQGDRDPCPGKPFQGGVFTAYLPDCQETKKLLPRLEKAFRRGLTFAVTGRDREARVTWDCIPHKTGLQGGKSQNGYPDSTYLKRLSEALTRRGIEE